ncbi:MAG: hypothetical protein ACTIB0_12550 [Corynebacterium casei]|uniref:hypothetical protein n=1 Tax=Corynebacterium casei TaxID=160386 RepID=UPI003F8EB456
MSDYNAEEDKNNFIQMILGFIFLAFLIALFGGWGAWLYALASVLIFGIPIVGGYSMIRSKFLVTVRIWQSTEKMRQGVVMLPLTLADKQLSGTKFCSQKVLARRWRAGRKLPLTCSVVL